MTYGIEGYGLYWACVEMIAGALTAENPTFELKHDAEILAHKFKIDTIKVENIMKYCIRIGLFEMDATNNRIYCSAILQMLDISTSVHPEIKKIKDSDNYKKLLDANSRLDKIRLDEINNNIVENFPLDNNNHNTSKDTIEYSPASPIENSLDIYSPLKTKEEENSSKDGSNSTSTNTRMQNKLIPVLRAWQNCGNLRQHKDSTAFRKLQKKHLDIVEDLGYDETVKAIQNYSKILASKEHYYSHPFALWNFLGRAVEEFLDLSKPFEMFKKEIFGQPEFKDPYAEYDESIEL